MISKTEFVSGRMSTILCAFDAGSRNEFLSDSPHPPGIAHMLEHSIFKGTAKRTAQELNREIAFLGGMTNAHTSNELVCYYIYAPYEVINQCVDILFDMIKNPIFPEEEFLKEREVVFEEYGMRADDIGSFVWENFVGTFFEGHHLANSIIGTPESIKNFKNSDVVDFYKKYYKSEHNITILTNRKGGIGLDQINDGFSHAHPSTQFTFKPSQTKLITKPDLNQSHVMIGYPGLQKGHDDAPSSNLLLEILGSGMDSRLYSEVREKRGLCYGIGSHMQSFRDTGVLMIDSSTQQGKVDEMLETVGTEIEKIKTELVTDEELQRAKNKVRTHVYMTMEDSHSIASMRMNEVFYNLPPLESRMEKLNQVTAEDVLRVANSLFSDHHKLTLICNPE